MHLMGRANRQAEGSLKNGIRTLPSYPKLPRLKHIFRRAKLAPDLYLPVLNPVPYLLSAKAFQHAAYLVFGT